MGKNNNRAAWLLLAIVPFAVAAIGSLYTHQHGSQSSVNPLSSAVVVLVRDEQIVGCSPRFLEIVAMRQADVLGRPIQEVMAEAPRFEADQRDLLMFFLSEDLLILDSPAASYVNGSCDVSTKRKAISESEAKNDGNSLDTGPIRD
jgi:hypothetical protein